MAVLTKARKPSHASALDSLERAVAEGRAPLARAVRGHFSGLRETIGPVSSDGRLMSGIVERVQDEHRTFYFERMGKLLQPAADAGEDHADMGGAIGGDRVSADVVRERQTEWVAFMAEGQRKAWEAAEDELSRTSLSGPERDDLLSLVTGHTEADAVRLVRSSTGMKKVLWPRHGALSKAIPASTLRNAGSLLGARAYRTAAYELARAYNVAERQKFGQALKLGLVREVRRTWVTSREENVCKVCAPLHGKTLVARTQGALRNAFDRARNLRYPPAHINCMCVVVYEVLG